MTSQEIYLKINFLAFMKKFFSVLSTVKMGTSFSLQQAIFVFMSRCPSLGAESAGDLLGGGRQVSAAQHQHQHQHFRVM